MKNKNIHIILLYGIILVLVGVVISNRNLIFDNNKIILKNMDESTQIADKEKAIDELNTSYSEYYNSIQKGKQEIANAIKDKGIETSELDSLETMASNIRNISKSNTIRNEILYDDITFEATNSSYSSYITKSNGTIYYSYGSGSYTGIQAELDLTDVKYVIYSCGHGWSSYAKNGLSSTEPSSKITEVSGMTVKGKDVKKLQILDVTELTGTYYFYAVGKNYVNIGDTDATFSLNYFGLIKDNVSVSNFHLEGVLQ